MPKVSLQNNFKQAAASSAAGLVGVWTYSYYSQTHLDESKKVASQRAT